MTIQDRMAAFLALGKQIHALPSEQLYDWQTRARNENPWFTPDSVASALTGISFMLSDLQLTQWLQKYSIQPKSPLKVGVVMAGNIPAVGFHDFLCVLLSGHILLAKLSSQDTVLLKEIAKLLLAIEPRFEEQIRFVERLTDADAFIATGSDNSARYFHHYFGKKPNIIRQNRTSCAVLTGDETAEELLALGRDIMQYFGLGCRNVAKLYIPSDYNFTHFLDSIQPLQDIIHHYKYANNYDYQKAVLLVNQIPHFDNGFLLLTENEALASPMAVVYYERYASFAEVESSVNANRDKIQCVVTKEGLLPDSLYFGQTQSPAVWEYADGVDTMQFLLSLPA